MSYIFKLLLVKQKVSLEIVLHLLKVKYKQLPTWFAKNYNLQEFKELQYVDLQLDLQKITTWKVVGYFFKSFK